MKCQKVNCQHLMFYHEMSSGLHGRFLGLCYSIGMDSNSKVAKKLRHFFSVFISPHIKRNKTLI
jgi:hypothetical protein